MKITFLIVFILINSPIRAQLTVHVDNEFAVTFINVEPDEYETHTNGDTITITPLLFEGLDGKILEFSKPVRQLRIKYELGFNQYTIDDNPAESLNFSVWTDYYKHDSNVLPDHYGNNPDAQRTFKFLGFGSQPELEASIFNSNISKIRKESLEIQTNFFQRLLKDDRFKVCCSEYIEQADNFLKSDIKSFLTLEGLPLEFAFQATLLEVTLTNGKNVFIKINK